VSVPIERIAEVAVVVSDLERSTRVYRDVLGLEVWVRQGDHADRSPA
jgi:catechol 2,3-dioxygenase-like lactoylglutathione lyase family enzyme